MLHCVKALRAVQILLARCMMASRVTAAAGARTCNSSDT